MIASNQADFMAYVRAGHFVLMDGAMGPSWSDAVVIWKERVGVQSHYLITGRLFEKSTKTTLLVVSVLLVVAARLGLHIFKL